MILRVLLAIILLTWSCGAPPEDEPVIGTAEQHIYTPDGWGLEGDATQCHVPWSGSTCSATFSKLVDLRVNQSNCPQQYQRDALLAAANRFKSFLEGLGTGWAVNVRTSGNYAGIGLNHTLACKSGQCVLPNGQHCIGGSDSTPKPYDNCTPVDDVGAFCRFNTSAARLYPSEIEAMFGWAGKTTAQKQRFWTNDAQHELYHGIGLGHNSTVDSLMYPSASSLSYDVLLAPTSTERNNAACYDPNQNDPACD